MTNSLYAQPCVESRPFGRFWPWIDSAKYQEIPQDRIRTIAVLLVASDARRRPSGRLRTSQPTAFQRSQKFSYVTRLAAAPLGSSTSVSGFLGRSTGEGDTTSVAPQRPRHDPGADRTGVQARLEPHRRALIVSRSARGRGDPAARARARNARALVLDARARASSHGGQAPHRARAVPRVRVGALLPKLGPVPSLQRDAGSRGAQ